MLGVTSRIRDGAASASGPVRALALLVLGTFGSVAIFLVIHQYGADRAVQQRAAVLDRALPAIQRELDSTTVNLQMLGATSDASNPDIGPLVWYQARLDHRGLLAAARLSNASAEQLRLLSSQTPVWANRALLKIDPTMLARARQTRAPIVAPTATPPEAPAGHRLFQIAIASPPAPGAKDGQAPVTLVLVDATSLLQGALAAAALDPADLVVFDQDGVIVGGAARQRLSDATSPFLRSLRFAGVGWTLRHARPDGLVSAWDWLAVPILLLGLAGTIVAALRGLRSAGPAPPLRAAGAGSHLVEADPALAIPEPARRRLSHPAAASSGGRTVAATPAAAGIQASPIPLADSPVEGFLEIDLRTGLLLRANPAAVRLLGYRDAAHLEAGSSDARRSLFAEAGAFDAMIETLRSSGPIADGFVGLRRIDGARLAATVAAWPVRDRTGQITSVALTLRDGATREALATARDEAEARNRAKSDFIANMSHELRTPLNAILGFSEIMTSQMFGALGSERYHQYAEDIHASGRHLLDVVNDVLDMAKIEASQFELNEEPVDLAGLAHDVVRLIEARAAEGGVRMRLDLDSLPPLKADSRLIRQVLLNLLSNAVKFTPPGGEVATIAYVEPSGCALLAVRDNGIGMRPEDIPRALEPFGQVRVSGGNGEGTGLGLPLAKTIVEAHQGALSIESELGVGTTVTVRLPAERVLRG